MSGGRTVKWIFCAEARELAIWIDIPARQTLSSFPSILLLSRVFFLSLCVIVRLLLLILNVFPRNPDLLNSELSPLLSAVLASVRKSIGDKRLRMVCYSFSGFDSY